MEPDYKKLHKASSHHESAMLGSQLCGCFYCKSLFEPQRISEWITEANGDKTALCPLCGIDSVLPDNIDEPLTKELLVGMHRVWFEM